MKEKYFACCGLISFDPRITNKKKDKIDEPLETKYQFDGIVEKGTKDGEKHEKFMRMNCRDPLVPPPYPPPYTALPILQYDPAKPAVKGVPEVIYDEESKESFVVGRMLGKGGFAKCYEVKNKEMLFACKVVSKLCSSRQKSKVLREIELHSELNHTHIVSFITSFEDVCNVYILLEHCSMKSLLHVSKCRGTLTEVEVKYYLRQILYGIRYLHRKSVIHRDIKLANMLLSENMMVKIADFGLATKIEFPGEKKMTVCGTPNYISPEVLQKKGHCFPVDLWAVGCLVYALLVGKPPFETHSLKETYSRICKNVYKIPSFVSLQAKDLLRGLLKNEPNERLDVKEALKHTFIYAHHIPKHLPQSSCHRPPDLTHILTRSQSERAKNSKKLQKKNINNNDITGMKNNIKNDSSKINIKDNSSHNNEKLDDIDQTDHNFVRTSSLKFKKVQTTENNNNNKNNTKNNKTLVNGNINCRKKSVRIEEVNIDKRNNSDTRIKSKNIMAINDNNKMIQNNDFINNISERTVSKKNNDENNLNYYNNTNTHSDLNRHHISRKTFPQKQSKKLMYTSSERRAAVSRIDPAVNHTEVALTAVMSKKNILQDGTSKHQAPSTFLLHEAICHCLNHSDPTALTSHQSAHPTWITKWVDYSNKYGFGFQLSDHSVGILFNDTTRMTISKRHRTLAYNDLSNRTICYSIDNTPSSLRNKLTLLIFFSKYMDEHLIQGAEDEAEPMTNKGIFVKKWFRTETSIVMLLSNGTVQVNFLNDHTKLIVSCENGDYVATFVDQQRQPLSYPLNGVSKPEVLQRLKFVKKMVEGFINFSGEAV